jgi:hypothetical protein
MMEFMGRNERDLLKLDTLQDYKNEMCHSSFNFILKVAIRPAIHAGRDLHLSTSMGLISSKLPGF